MPKEKYGGKNNRKKKGTLSIFSQLLQNVFIKKLGRKISLTFTGWCDFGS
jgi:hypothetical protein